MAQVAIPLLMLGTAYLVCNDNSKEEKKKDLRVKRPSRPGWYFVKVV